MVRGELLTRYFLEDGIRGTEQYAALDPGQVAGLDARMAALWQALAVMPRASEADTETVMIYPLLDELGWRKLTQAGTDRARRDIADAVLFLDDAALASARAERDASDRLRHGAVIVENEARDTPLDRASGKRETPSSQVLRYMRRAEVATGGALRWGLLTNGRLWRLYDFRGRVKAEAYVEIDAERLAALPPGERRDHWMRVLLLLFSPEAHRPGIGGASFLDHCLAEGRRYEQRVTASLSRAVFDRVFPELIAAIGEAPGARPGDPAWRVEAGEAALRLLYRLLFLLYAEDRDLLPMQHEGYAPYSLRKMRQEAAQLVDAGTLPPEGVHRWWPGLHYLFTSIDGGRPAMGLPPYNGGLFDDAHAPLLGRLSLPDRVLVPLLDAMSRAELDGKRGWINYRDLSVQQLGGIYERLLECEIVVGRAGGIEVRSNPDARRAAGAYYTPDELVMLILRRTVGPLLEERRRAFAGRVAALRAARTPRAETLAILAALDPATAFLSLRVCDPAMGSGHFLVSLVDYLADEVLLALTEAQDLVPCAEGQDPYRSPLAGRIVGLREHIRAEAAANGWAVRLDQLDDKHLVRRIILKRVIYGADLNPMAVELAKLSLWLHSFTVGAPLSFLDHHLRPGDSLCGETYATAVSATSGPKAAGQTDIFVRDALNSARGAMGYMQRIEDATDADIGEVERSAADFGLVVDGTRPLAAFLDLVQARRWMPDLTNLEARALGALLVGSLGNPVAIATGQEQPQGPAAHRDAAVRVVARARALAQRRRFLHWQVAFPGVWTDWEQQRPPGGFDAVVGNPPYVRQESIRDAKPALRELYPDTFDGAADLYVYFFERALGLLKPGGRLGFVVTNKWLKSGYAEKLRGHFADAAWVETVVDSGHAKGFFPDADVMPCIAVVRRPVPGEDGPAEVGVSVIAAGAAVPGGAEAQVAAARFALPRARLGPSAWVLEPPDVLALLDKVRRNGTPLREYAGCGPMYGIKTGFNEAFVVDGATRNRLIAEDGRSGELIRPYLRGQDVDRWAADWDGQWMIFARHGTRIDDYPAVKAHLARFRRELEPRPAAWERKHPGTAWPGRKPGSYEWFEIQDNVAYWAEFEKPKIIFRDIMWTSSFAIDKSGTFLNNTLYFLPTSLTWIAVLLNSPISWWFSWRAAQHAKDEALRYFGDFVEPYPIPEQTKDVEEWVVPLQAIAAEQHQAKRLLAGWYRHAWGVEKPSQVLQSPFGLDADGFALALRRALPGRRRVTAADVAEMAREHAATVAPMARRLAEARRHERALSALVNQVYGLTPEEEALMWRTAPPRMPLAAPAAMLDAAAD